MIIKKQQSFPVSLPNEIFSGWQKKNRQIVSVACFPFSAHYYIFRRNVRIVFRFERLNTISLWAQYTKLCLAGLKNFKEMVCQGMKDDGRVLFFERITKPSSKLIAHPVKKKRNKNKLAAGYLEKENFLVSFFSFWQPNFIFSQDCSFVSSFLASNNFFFHQKML